MTSYPRANVPSVPPAAARINDALRGGSHALEQDRRAAAMLEERWPGIGAQLRRAAAWHAEAALRAVTVTEAHGEPWPPARSVAFAAAGYPPNGWDEAVLPHQLAAAAAEARFLYLDADPVITLTWHAALAGDPRASARPVPAAMPAEVVRVMRLMGMAEPWSVQLQLCAHWWRPRVAKEVVAGWARELPPRSSLVLTVPVPGGINPRGEAGAIVGRAAGAVPHRHSPEDIAGWITGAGMRLSERGIRDVREKAGHGWAHEALGEGLVTRIIGAVGLRP